jgi:hypothetical protein
MGLSQYEHRLLAEKTLNRRMAPGEVVHHINGRRGDNRLENLCVLTEGAHDAYHGWYDWIHAQYGVYPRRETQMRKLKEEFGGIILSDHIRDDK